MPTNLLNPMGCVFSRYRRGASPTFEARKFKIKQGYATKIAYGDLVSTGGPGANQGYVILTPNNPVNILGVFAGFPGPYFDTNFNDSSFGLKPMGGWPGAAAAANADVDCLVITDPDAVYRMQVVGGPFVQAWRGLNINFTAGTNGVPGITSLSALSLDATTVSQNAALPFRIEGIVEVNPAGGVVSGGGATDPAITNPWVEVSLNFGINEQLQAAGI